MARELRSMTRCRLHRTRYTRSVNVVNILIKLTCLVGLVIAPILGGHSSGDDATDHRAENTEHEIVIEDAEEAITDIGE